MEIIDKRIAPKVPFCNLEPGDVFYWKGRCYLKIYKGDTEYNTIDISNACHAFFHDFDSVTQVHASLTIENMGEVK